MIHNIQKNTIETLLTRIPKKLADANLMYQILRIKSTWLFLSTHVLFSAFGLAFW